MLCEIQIQDKTKAELCKVTKEKEMLENEIETLKKSDMTESHEKNPRVMKFFKCTDCESTLSSSDRLSTHTKEHVKEVSCGCI